MTTIAELTPHQWRAVEYTLARVAQRCAIEGNHTRMRQYLQQLKDDSPPAYEDFLYALAVMHPIAREIGGRSTPDRLRVPCRICGHDDGAHIGTDWVGDCPECPDGRCQPRRVPVGAAQTVTVTDGETEVE